jgi:glycosyltransferase involved in cell wall biosynthesis
MSDTDPPSDRRRREPFAGTRSAGDASADDGVWIVIPAYNEARTIRGLAETALSLCVRVLIVDDGSSDGTAAQLDGLPLTVLRHPVNRGKAAGLRAAFAHALALGATCVVTIDGDGQHDPRDASKLLGVWRQCSDRLVIGARLHDRARIPRARYFGNRIACFWISWAAGHPVADTQSGFRVYPRAVMEIALADCASCSGFTFESEIIIAAAQRGHRTLAATIGACYPADARPSHYRPGPDTMKIIAMVATRLLSKGLSPRGLWRSLQREPEAMPSAQKALDGHR